jgi:hypothetical protein
MSEGRVPAQSVAQAGSSGQAASVGPAVGVLRGSDEAPVMGVERRRDAGLDGRRGRGRRLRKEISLYDEKSPTLSVVALANGAMEPDPESRIREIRSSGLMRGEVAQRNRQLRSVQSARSTSPTLPPRQSAFQTLQKIAGAESVPLADMGMQNEFRFRVNPQKDVLLAPRVIVSIAEILFKATHEGVGFVNLDFLDLDASNLAVHEFLALAPRHFQNAQNRAPV